MKNNTLTFYVAYSIHGTNCFITARLDTVGETQEQVLARLGSNFSIVQSRRPEASAEGTIKLHWTRLLSLKGNPLVSEPAVLNRFKILERMGFVVDRKKFITKFLNK